MTEVTTTASTAGMPGTSDLAVTMNGVNKWYGQFHALKDITLTVARGERIVICGPSGSGKSTLIRCINRLESIQKGKIVVDGHDLGAGAKSVDVVRQETGMVFQSFNLFPHMTVLENCTLAPIKVRGVSSAEAEATARKFLERVRIPEQADKYPAQLSGGQQQRVAIARALVRRPGLLIADEPAASLDPSSGRDVMELFSSLCKRQGITLLFTSHDIQHARSFADRVVALRKGPIFLGRSSADLTDRDLEETFDV